MVGHDFFRQIGTGSDDLCVNQFELLENKAGIIESPIPGYPYFPDLKKREQLFYLFQ
jgi:hypothetical protein